MYLNSGAGQICMYVCAVCIYAFAMKLPNIVHARPNLKSWNSREYTLKLHKFSITKWLGISGLSANICKWKKIERLELNLFKVLQLMC
uniref:GM05237p n=1 Tax=Drosophila melanogaster TaxID=7227 RepID=Q8T3N4_DROME|nr:GM05237p [Drosophila melanogaster]